MSNTILSSRFSPRIVPADALEKTFVGRHRLLDHLTTILLQSARRKVGRYGLVHGPRGAGKSHLMALLGHRLRPAATAGELLLVELGEEEHIAQLVAFFAKILGALPERAGEPSPAELVRTIQKTPRADQLRRAIGLLEERVGAQPLVLLVENLDRLFDAIKPEGQSRLRALLAAHPGWCLFGASCTYGEAFTSPEAPFFQSFERFTLPELSLDDSVEMLRNLARLHNDFKLLGQLGDTSGRAQVGAIRHLLGANPRALALVFPFLRHRRLNDLEGVFLDLAEELTPYFQEQMARRAAGQQPYLEQLAETWGTLSVSELAERCFDSPTTASGQLRYLHQDGLVRSFRLGRETFYELADPLHRIAWAMKRPERLPATLAKFVAAWIPRREVGERVGGLGGVDLSGSAYAMALNLPFEDESEHAERQMERIEQREDKAPEEAYEEAKALAEREPLFAHLLKAFQLACRLGAPELEHYADKILEIAEVPPLPDEEEKNETGESTEQVLVNIISLALLGQLVVQKRRLSAGVMTRLRALARLSSDPDVWELLLIEHGAEREVLVDVTERLVAHYKAGNTIRYRGLLRLLSLAEDSELVSLLGLAVPARSLSVHDRTRLVLALLNQNDEAALRSLGDTLNEGARGEHAHSLKALRLVLIDPNAALKIARSALKKWPESFLLLIAAQRASLQLGLWRDTIHYANRLMNTLPEVLVGLHSVVALAHHQLGEHDAAQGHMAEALRGPPHAIIYANIAAMFLDDPPRILQTLTNHHHPSSERIKALARLARGERVEPIEPIAQPAHFMEVFTVFMLAASALIHDDSPANLTRWLNSLPFDAHPYALDALCVWVITLRTGTRPTRLSSAQWEVLEPNIPEGGAVMLRALDALPENPRIYSQLAEPARALLRTRLKELEATALLAALPDESS
ncbi:AAA family ATPase [Myxococcota bacterium]|nr:AAA family ATPase [Myxococcota bacterium]